MLHTFVTNTIASRVHVQKTSIKTSDFQVVALCCCSVLGLISVEPLCFATHVCVLQCIVVCCRVLQYVAVFGSMLQCGAVCFSVLQCVAVYCTVAKYCFVLQCIVLLKRLIW